jgi:hypothetical protein
MKFFQLPQRNVVIIQDIKIINMLVTAFPFMLTSLIALGARYSLLYNCFLGCIIVSLVELLECA